jgi:hypothetical protein
VSPRQAVIRIGSIPRLGIRSALRAELVADQQRHHVCDRHFAAGDSFRNSPPSWFNRFRRLLIRWEKRAKNYLGFFQLAAIVIVYRKLRHARSLSG